MIDLMAVSLKRLCEAIGVSMQGQLRNLKNWPWATVNIMFTVAEDGKQRELTMIDLRKMAAWLAIINENGTSSLIRPCGSKAFRLDSLRCLALWP